MNDSEVCKYAYKPCTNPRVAKKDGDLHRLCEFHRDKANAVQKIYATRRRQERRSERQVNLVQKLLGTIEPVPFEHGQQAHDLLTATEREMLEVELAGLLDEDRDIMIGTLDEQSPSLCSWSDADSDDLQWPPQLKK
ncbi:hypothetical protein DYB37_010608 [Aphanomyces astaci]|nr:hypothetical protein AaE_004921 [Aphanomyces astaci]RHY03570.1 hypothetical protein DYB36_007627 [Aphanomyces astaci]RHY05047.1 hypothetical protein DYB25_010394 [Aphanomyces astaci]RHY43311.1 hypothetical protein DYB34_011755 [Aphanomyces astaci]RHY54025.1 hypothetical protein DYB38_001478 [Aphanomyces astaci]